MDLLLFLVLLVLLDKPIPAHTKPPMNKDCAVLVDLKSKLVNPNSSVFSSWNDSISCCHWSRVNCSKRHPDRVTSLRLNSLGMAGEIPPSLAKLSFLRALDLSGNNLSGAIPSSLATLKRLAVLNLSNNSLEGEVPTGGIFSNLSLSSISGNGNLCGGDPKLNLRSCSEMNLSQNKSSEMKKPLTKPVLASIILTAAVILSMALFLIFRFQWHPPARNPMILPEPEDPRTNRFPRLSYNDLKRATRRFARTNLIGKGAFGSVYYGILEATGEFVAVKVFHQEMVEASKSFMDECMVLKSLRHRNLVRIVTACSSEDENSKEFRALVYKFMPNGSLDSWIHKKERRSASLLFRIKRLNLLQILNIAIDIASGLDYLHNHIQTPIVHRDLKPSNILLDGDMKARLSDFGISRILLPDEDTLTTGIKGTIGYIPPECAMGCPVSTSWDVYSFGVLLIEMITGKRPTEIGEDLTLVEYARNNFPTNMIDIIDRSLVLEEKDGRLTERSIVCLSSVIGIALSCSREQPKERIGISDALKQLEVARKSYLELGGRRNVPN